MKTLYLVRHGITPANRENRFAGRTEEELHPEGAEQIRQVGERLMHESIGAIYCGPAKRTVQSAEILAAMLDVSHSPVPELDEINIPHWDGLTKDEIRSEYGSQYPTWLAAPEEFKVSDCETLQQVQDRAVRGVECLLAQHPSDNLLLVSHLIVLRCLVLHYRGLPIRDFRSIKIDNGAILRIMELQDGQRSVNYI